MDINQTQGVKHKSLFVVVIVLESLIILSTLVFGAYLGIKILYYKLPVKVLDSRTINTVVTKTPDADCPEGKVGTSQGADYKILGKSKFNIGGKNVVLCCATSESKAAQAKVCSDKNNNYMVFYSKTGDNYILGSEMYPQGEKRCIKSYKENGENTELCV